MQVGKEKSLGAFQYNKDKNCLDLSGDFSVQDVASFAAVIHKIIPMPGFKIDYKQITSLDTCAAQLLIELEHRLLTENINFSRENVSKNTEAVLQMTTHFLPVKYISQPSKNFFSSFFEKLGSYVFQAYRGILEMFNFLGICVVGFFQIFFHPTRIFPAVFQSAERTGVAAIPIIIITSAVIGVVLAYEAAVQLSKFGAKMATMDLLSYSMLREAGVLITAVVMAGRSGSAFAAELGSMKIREEVDALQVMGMNPLFVLVLPRILTLIVFMPILTLISDIAGMISGAVVCHYILNIEYHFFWLYVREAVTPMTFWIGIIKAPFFGLVIGVIGCLEGMKVDGNPESVGRRTTKSVVQAIFLVILLNGAFSMLFTHMEL